MKKTLITCAAALLLSLVALPVSAQDINANSVSTEQTTCSKDKKEFNKDIMECMKALIDVHENT